MRLRCIKMELKKYQQKTIDLIKAYLREMQYFGDPKHAFISVTNTAYKDEFFGEQVPFVCVKIPTGGGKTLVGCKAVAEIKNKESKLSFRDLRCSSNVKIILTKMQIYS